MFDAKTCLEMPRNAGKCEAMLSNAKKCFLFVWKGLIFTKKLSFVQECSVFMRKTFFYEAQKNKTNSDK